VYAFHLADRFFYGFPDLGDGTVKLAEHLRPDPVPHPDGLDRELRLEDLAPLADFARRCLPGVDPQPARHSICMYTMSPDQHFIIDLHPAHANVAFAAGFSGHGFKFAPLVGEILADLALTGRTDHPAGFLRASRLTGAAPLLR
jgi:glycine/D-amino acid oxidase-like deaminating enzyme